MASDWSNGRCWLAEIYAPSRGTDDQIAEAERIRDAAQTLTAKCVSVRYLQSIVVPDEETALYLFEAGDAPDVARVLRDVGLEPERISLATTVLAETHLGLGHRRARSGMAGRTSEVLSSRR